jgi:hypothetical protein
MLRIAVVASFSQPHILSLTFCVVVLREFDLNQPNGLTVFLFSVERKDRAEIVALRKVNSRALISGRMQFQLDVCG